MKSIHIIDDFLTPEDYAEVMELSKDIHLHEAEDYSKKYGTKTNDYAWKTWNGCRRSDNYVDFLDFFSDKVNLHYNVKISRLEFFTHPLEKFPIYEQETQQHIDALFEFSGVLYLDEGAVGLGTTIGTDYVEWKPNRLVTFPALTYHNPHFGGTERTVLTFFSHKKKL